MKFAVFEPSIRWGEGDTLIGIYDDLETADQVAHGMWAPLNRYIVEIKEEETSDK